MAAVKLENGTILNSDDISSIERCTPAGDRAPYWRVNMKNGGRHDDLTDDEYAKVQAALGVKEEKKKADKVEKRDDASPIA